MRCLALAVGFGVAASAATNSPVTFHKDVAPILQKRCQGCHRPGEIGPMSLLTYQEARPWAKSMREAVLTKKMPPWFADAAHGKFDNDRSLTGSEIETLAAWADGGAREGDAKHAPRPAPFAEGWSIGKPDLVLETPNEFNVPPSGTIDYQFVVVPTGFTEDQWIEKLEVRPGARQVVHHVVVFAREPGSPWLRTVKPGVPLAAPNSRPKDPAADDGSGLFWGAPGVEIICTYAPGAEPYLVKPGQGRLIKAGSDLVFQLHYTTSGTAAADRSRIAMVFAKEPPKQRVKNMLVWNPKLRIPPGAANHRVDARVTLQSPASVTSLFPHMHVRGRGFEYRAVYPDGRSEILLRVPKYDFNWQLTYFLAEPRLLPKGTRIECTAYYDNSPNNAFNPNPKDEVFWGDQTWDEMLAGFLDLAFDVSLDPNELIRGSQAPARTGGLD